MAQRVFQFAATIPAGTPQSAPVTVPLAIDNWNLESIDLEVPPGPSGLMGFYVANNGVQWIPATPGAWLVWDDVQQSWWMQDQPNASGWEVTGYNTGVYPHSVIVRMHVNPTTTGSTSTTPATLTVVTTQVAEPATTVLD